MKRAISFLLVLVMCLSLCACGKSEKVKKENGYRKEIREYENKLSIAFAD